MEENKPITPLEFDIKVREALECKEKKSELTDEEIIKVLESCLNDECQNCPYNGWNCNDMDRDILNLIRRLQDENNRKTDRLYDMCNKDHDKLMKIREQKVEIERLSFYKTVFDKGLAVSLVNMQETIDKQKAEIERMTEERDKAKRDNTSLLYGISRVEKENAELQKQVDELKEENKELYKENTTLIAGSILERKDIAKDTAKEIFAELYKETIKDGIPAVYCMLTPKEIKDRAKRYGVEVE